MINLAESAVLANEIANTPEILPSVSWTGEAIDLQPSFDEGSCFIIENGTDGCYVLVENSVSTYVIHTLFKRGTPSSVVIDTAREGMWISFVELDAVELTSSACETNPAAYRLMRKNGMRPLFDSPSKFAKGKKQRYCGITIDDYIINNPFFQEVGAEFHNLVEETTDHEDDAVHDRYVGAAISMIRCGNADKAETVYNKWALMAGYAPITFNEEENTVEAGYMTIHLSDDLQTIGGISCQ